VIRRATTADEEAIAAIYNQGIAERQSTFETEPRQPGDLSAALVLVAERDGRVVGWAAVSAYSDRCVYAGVGEYTIYLDRAARGAGLGRALLEALADAAQDAGYYKLVGKLFTTNEASIALARRCGFRQVGVHKRHGRLDDDWRDVLVVERSLA
jgi:phosphinothricin acetyltransferase